MKKSACYLLTLAILLSTMCNMVSTETVKSCSNPFTVKFSKSKDEKVRKMVLSTPQTGEFSICANVWGAFGTCCQPDKMKEVAQSEIDKWATQLKNFLKKVNQFEKIALKRTWQIKKKVADIKAWLENHASEAYASQDAVIRAKKYAENFDTIFSFFEDETTYKERKDKFTKEMKVCFEKVRDFRINALCYTCSGNATQFMDTSKTLRISRGFSIEIMKHCVGSWSYIYNFMQTAKSIVLLSKIQKSKGLKDKTGAKKLEAPEEVGVDTTNEAQQLSAALKGFSQFTPETISISMADMFVVAKLLVFEGYNDDISGDGNIIEEAIKEEREEEQKENKMSKEEKEVFASKIKKVKESAQKQKVETMKKVNAMFLQLKQSIEGSKNVTKIVIANIAKSQAKIAEIKKSTATSEAEKKKSIDKEYNTIKQLIIQDYNTYQSPLMIGSQIYGFCPAGECNEMKKTISDFNKEFSESKKKTLDLYKEQNDAFAKLYKEQLNAKFEAFNKVYKEAKELYSKIIAAETKAQASRLLASTTTTNLKADDSEVQKMKTKLTELVKDLTAKQSEMEKWYPAEYEKNKHYFIQIPYYAGSFSTTNKRMKVMLKLITDQNNRLNKRRILQEVTPAKSTVSVEMIFPSVLLPQKIEKIPTVSTTTPDIVFTSSDSFGSMLKVFFTLFALTFWFM